MGRVWLGLVFSTLLLCAGTAHAGANDFIETFALAPDRSVPLKQLIPGTRDYYYYHALHFQNQGQLSNVDALLKRWTARYRYDSRRKEIENRQALLRYSTDPKTSLGYLIKVMGVRLFHMRSVAGRKRQYPTSLAARKISWATLSKKALSRSRYSLSRFTNDALFWLSQQQLRSSLRRKLLRRLRHPMYPGVVSLIAADLAQKYSRGFGSMTLHHLLTLSQMDALLKRRPSLLKESRFVNIYLKKLRPGVEQNWKDDAKSRKAYLARLSVFAEKLPPSFNSLKLNILYHQLKVELSQGIFDQQKFISYIQLPRYATYANSKYVREQPSRRYVANLYSRFSSVTGLARIGNDEPLVRTFLTFFFQKEGGYQSYAAYLNSSYLKRVFAETKLLYGIGDAEKWYSLLPASHLKSLKERVTLNFAPTNKKIFGAKEAVSLALDIKNVKNLIVKVYRVNAKNYYRKLQREVQANLTLDGLVANQEKVYRYGNTTPLRLVRRTFSFPKLTKRGVYVIDFIGNGKNSRALIRKGKLRFVERIGVAGHVLTVLDEAGKLAPQAHIWHANRIYRADKSGSIHIPFTAKPGWKKIILGSAGFVSLARFYHRRESYQFRASIFVERESLLTRQQATVLIRPTLLLYGKSAPLKLIQNVSLQMTATDRFGVHSKRKVANFKLYENKESSYSFRVPENLSSISFTLTGTIKKVSQNKTVNLRAYRSFRVNQIDRTSHLATFHLGRSSAGYFLDLLDRTGRPWPHRIVYLHLKHRGLKYKKYFKLQTNAKGRISLGILKDITWMRARTSGSIRREWNLSSRYNHIPSQLQGNVGQTLYLPYPGKASKPQRDELALLEKRAGTYVADYFSSLRLKNGLVSIQDLPAGDYELRYHKLNHTVIIRVTKGTKVGEYWVGKHRALQRGENQPLQIAGMEIDKKQLSIQLVNANAWTRVHVFATRYVPRFHPFDFLNPSRKSSLAWWSWRPLRSDYRVGRSIGEEYRYILERKYAKKYPGNMLERPSLLLNPWAIHKTQTRTQSATTGHGFRGMGSRGYGRGGGGRAGFGKGRLLSRSYGMVLPNLDFLPEQSAVLVNLKPNKDGVVTVKRSALGGHSQIHVLAIDPDHTAYRRLTVDETPLTPKDLRLRANLSSKKHYTQQSRIEKVGKGQSFELKDITTSKFEITDSLSKVYTLFSTLNRSSKLRAFRFVLSWPTLSDKEKRKKYSKYACHELHFFLYKKDPVFFQKVVLPYLKNKKDKTFMDHWLLGDDPVAYLRPWAYSQLNMVERILLAQHLVGEKAQTARHLRELFEILRPNPRQTRLHFETVLQLGALQTRGPLGNLRKLAEKLRQQKDASKSLDDSDDAPSTVARPTAAPSPKAPARYLQYRKKSKRRARRRFRSLLEGKKNGLIGRYERAEKEMQLRRKLRQYYRALEKTKEWVENNYYRLPISAQNASLVRVNAFWRDYAAHDSRKPFASKHVAQASRNFTEMMFALSVLDLPFTSPKHKTTLKKVNLVLRAGGELLVFFKAIQEAEAPKTKTPILVSQNFYQRSRRYRYIRGRRVERYISDEFLARKVYGCQVVVTNPTGTRQKLELLVQIPQGALPVSNGRYTHTLNVNLGAYRTRRFNYYFYFPRAGSFDHFPVHVSRNGKLLAFAAPKPIKVVNQPSKVDKQSWGYVSQRGSLKDVLNYLETHNLQRTNLARIAWRMKSKSVFTSVIALLRKHHVYHRTLWGYGFKHNDEAAMQDYIQHHTSFSRNVGMSINSPLLTLNPVARRTYEHMEYSPLVNARAHRLARKPRIVNNRLLRQYKRFLKLLTYHKALTGKDRLDATYYMLLQDRIATALTLFSGIHPSKLMNRLQYDYFKVYLSFYSGNLKVARTVAEKYRNYPVNRWQARFVNALHQLDEIEGKTKQSKVVNPKDHNQKQTQQAARSASFSFALKDKNIAISHRNISQFRIHYYLMDIELLFSRSPFVQKHSNQFAFIQPNLVQLVKATKKGNVTTLSLPKRFHNSNVMVEISAAGLQRARAYFSNSLNVQISENYGQLRVASASPDKVLPKVYVKVYAKLNNGSVIFYKDGYTDLRGRFDYSSLSTNTLNQVKRFSLLILSPKYGAVVREAAPPKQ